MRLDINIPLKLQYNDQVAKVYFCNNRPVAVQIQPSSKASKGAGRRLKIGLPPEDWSAVHGRSCQNPLKNSPSGGSSLFVTVALTESQV